MRKNHVIARHKLGSCFLILAAILFFSSCAQDGFDDKEKFTCDVNNSQLESPSADSITIAASADGAYFTATWPVVFGAGGYQVSVYDVSDMENPIIKDSLIDGCSMRFNREEDMNYKFVIKTMGNKNLNNIDAKTSTEKAFSTFTSTYQTIPDGTDIYAYFQEHPLPADSIGRNINYDLVAGGNYTMSDAVDFGANTVTLRSTSKSERVSIKFTGINSGFVLSSGLTLKYLDFDCDASVNGFINMSKSPAITGVGSSSNYYFVNDPISVVSCNIDNMHSFFFWDSKTPTWFPSNVIVKDCLVHCVSTDTQNLQGGAYFWTSKGNGYIRSLSISNSTFYNTGSVDVKYFVQYGGSSTSQTLTYGWINNTISYDHCTFYNICSSGQWGNYNGIAGKATSYWKMTNCIFYNCSTSGVARRFLAGKSSPSTSTFSNNTYMKPDGTFDSPSGYDDSGTDIKSDPVFKDPTNGNFSISGSTQVSLGTGDPRWLPSAK